MKTEVQQLERLKSGAALSNGMAGHLLRRNKSRS